MLPPWQQIGAQISAATGQTFRAQHQRPVTGGCINSAWVVGDGGRRFFVKTTTAGSEKMLRAEAAGLELIATTQTVRVPRPCCLGHDREFCWLVLEFLEFESASPVSQALLGERLAAMHAHSAPSFGLDHDNTIGSTPQPNQPDPDWIIFWRHRRLNHQLGLALDQGYDGRLQLMGVRLAEVLPVLFSDYRPPPSLLHGDLWGGNAAALQGGEPVIFDPAVYYGDREADIAMTELFGGFGPSFYQAYRSVWPMDAGYRVRRKLYNLYHLLNHLNLFGSGYLSRSEELLEELLAETGG